MTTTAARPWILKTPAGPITENGVELRFSARSEAWAYRTKHNTGGIPIQSPELTLIRDTTGTEIGAIRIAADGTHIAARPTEDGHGYIPVGEYATHQEAENALRGRTTVHATRSTTSPAIGYYEPFQVTDFDPWRDDDTPPAVIATEYRAYLTDGTPAGRPIHWGARIAPATNQYPTETKARAAIRKAHRHLYGS